LSLIKCKILYRIWGACSFPAAIAASTEEEWLEPGYRRIYKSGRSNCSCADPFAKP
jgi:hypothetical protein